MLKLRLGPIIASNTAISPGPLRPRWAASFRGGRYKTIILRTRIVAYRLGSSDHPDGNFFSLQKPRSIVQGRIDSAIRHQWEGRRYSDINAVFTVAIEAGKVVHVGRAGYQGGLYIGGALQLVVENAVGVKVLNMERIT